MENSSNGFILGVGPAKELQTALRRNGLGTRVVDWLCAGDNISLVNEVVLGRSEIKLVEHSIDYDIDQPSIPAGWSLLSNDEQLPNRVRSLRKFDPTKLSLHLDNSQKNGKAIEGNKLRKKLESIPVFGAQLRDFLLKNLRFIPKDWKGKEIFFWGTLYRDANGDFCVPFLFFDNGGWRGRYRWLVNDLSVNSPAVVLAE